MEIRKKSWIYQKTYRCRATQPDAISPLRFCWDIFLALLATGFYWLVVGIFCFLFAWKRAKDKDKENFFTDIEKWPTILGHRIWPISLIGLGFIVWPFINFNSWKEYEIVVGITLIYAVMFISIAFTTRTWEKINERTKIVFIENGKA